MEIITVRQCPRVSIFCLPDVIACDHNLSLWSYPSVLPFSKCSKTGGWNSLRTMLRPYMYMPKQKLVVRVAIFIREPHDKLRWTMIVYHLSTWCHLMSQHMTRSLRPSPSVLTSCKQSNIGVRNGLEMMLHGHVLRQKMTLRSHNSKGGSCFRY